LRRACTCRYVGPTAVARLVTDESLVHCVSEVRKAIGDDDQAIIKAIPRRGFLTR
jgi:DNA-binding winged helix-turn-helix (wHTH) protein